MIRLAYGQSWLSRIAAGVVLALAIVAGIALSAFFFSFFLIIAAALTGWLSWQRWRIRRRFRKDQHEANSDIIQGEYKIIHEEHTVASKPQQSPRQP